MVLPALVLVGLHATDSPSLGPGERIDVAVPGVIALCVISASFTSQAISTGFDRRYAVLRYLGTTPLGRGGLVTAKVVATLAVEILQIAVIAALGVALGWRPDLSGVPYAVLFVIVGTWAFVALALLLAGTLRAEAVLALANLLWVLLLVGGGVVVPRTQLPDGLSDVAALLPSAGLADGLRSALVDGTLNLPALGVVVVWGATRHGAGRALLPLRRLIRRAHSAARATSLTPDHLEATVFDYIFGLPMHPLIIHAVVVLVPLSALVAIAFAVRPTWRHVLRWPLAVGGVVSGVTGLRRRRERRGAAATGVAGARQHDRLRPARRARRVGRPRQAALPRLHGALPRLGVVPASRPTRTSPAAAPSRSLW